MIPDTDLTLLINDFASFRATRSSRRQPFPDDLWQRAMAQARLLPPTRVAKSLGLSSSALTSHIKKMSPEKKAKTTKCRLAPVVMVLPPVINVSPLIEILSPAGVRLFIKDLDVKTMSRLVADLMQGAFA